MAEKKKTIVGLKRINIKWLSNNSFSLDGEDVGLIEVDAFIFNDDTIIGKVEYPFSIVVGKYIENLGAYLTILDEETGRMPLTAIASVSKDGQQKHFYGSLSPVNVDNPQQAFDSALTSISSTNLLEFEQESISDVSQKISFGVNQICSFPSANNIMYSGAAATTHEEYLKYIQHAKDHLDTHAFNKNFQYLDAIEFAEFGDE